MFHKEGPNEGKTCKLHRRAWQFCRALLTVYLSPAMNKVAIINSQTLLRYIRPKPPSAVKEILLGSENKKIS